jgi:cell division protein FtsW
MLASASQVKGWDNYGDGYYYLKRQLLFGVLPGVFFLIILQAIDYRYWQKLAIPFFVFSIILLIAVLVPFLNYTHGGAQRWLNLGFISFQPSEITKLSFIIFLSAWLTRKKSQIQNFHYTFLPFLIYLALIVLLIGIEPDMGTLSIILFLALGVYLIAGAKLMHIGVLIFICSVVFVFLIQMAPYRMNRITAYLYPKIDTKGVSYQINQSLLAIGSGGVFGVGLGQSKQKYLYLPEATEDSIFAIIAEELGFIVSTVFIVIYLYFIVSIFLIAQRVSDNFARYLSCGVGLWFGYQGLLNIGAMLNLWPLTGVPLPFVSYGGTSLVVSMAAVGILINISKDLQ